MGRLALCAVLLAAVAGFAAAGSSARRAVLTEFGATRAVWAKHHKADPNRKLVRGCCFLPRQKDGTDRYYVVHYGQGTHVDSFEMSFVPTIPTSLARWVVKHEAGPGARVVYDLNKAGCEQIEYRSTLLSRAVGGAMFAELSRDSIGGAPNGHVGDVIFQALPIGTRIGC